MSLDFVGRVALVTGSGSGIGRASAQTFARRGAKVVVADLDRTGGTDTVASIREAGGEASFLEVDATSEVAIKRMVDFVIETYGRLDAAHNNVGHPGPYGSLTEISLDDFEHCHRLNTLSCFLAMKHEIPLMLRNGGGAIVNTASLAGLIGNPNGGPYVSAKHAVIGLTKTAALEFATRKVRVNAICPGGTDTPMLRGSMVKFGVEGQEFLKHWVEPMGRFATSQEQADAAVWLCSDAASFVTGHILPVDGGHMAGNRATSPDMT